FEELGQKNKQFLTKTLSEQQNKRLDQIATQFTALQHLTKAKVAKKLKLTEEQLEKLKVLQTKARKELVNLMNAKAREEKKKRFANLREKPRRRILEILKKEQKAQVREMAGPPFTGEIVFEEPGSKEK